MSEIKNEVQQPKVETKKVRKLGGIERIMFGAASAAIIGLGITMIASGTDIIVSIFTKGTEVTQEVIEQSDELLELAE